MRHGVVLDYETNLLDGTPSVEFYRPDFRATSCAFAWRKGGGIHTFYAVGESQIEKALRFFARRNAFFICHNIQFETGVTYHRFPGYESMFEVDTMRLVQNYDGGGKHLDDFHVRGELSVEEEFAWINGESSYETGLGLQASASRLLDKEHHSHKKKYHNLCIERGGKKHDLNLLTPDELKEYNIADVLVTLALYEKLTADFEKMGFDWTKDHFLYKSTAYQTMLAKSRGVLVDREQVKRHVEEKGQQIEEMQARFRERFRIEIRAIEATLLEREVSSYKSEAKRLEVAENPPRFNPRSTKQKAMLFVDLLGMEPKFFTKKGAPSFASKFSKQWGEGGDILKKQQTYMLEKKQGENLLGLSEWNGRYFPDIKACGTQTNRLAGGRNE